MARLRLISGVAAGGLLAAAMAVPARTAPPGRATAGAGGSLPIFKVVHEGLTKHQGALLDGAFHLDGKPRPHQGTLLYLDPQRFLFLPHQAGTGGQPDESGQETAPIALSLGKIRKMDTLSNHAAMSEVHEVMEEVGIDFQDDFHLKGKLKATHTFFDVFSIDGKRTTHVPLDTGIGARFSLGGLPLVGPGANFEIDFGAHPKRKSRDVVSHLSASLYEVKQGHMVHLIPHGEAVQDCIERFQAQVSASLTAPIDVHTRLVYYAPPLDVGADALFPHYECTGSTTVEGREVLLRPVFIFAILDGIGPQVTISASRDEFLKVYATANVAGGTPPYRFVWTSTTTTLPPSVATAGASISYDPRPRDQTQTEVLNVWVADANDLTDTASISLGSNVGTLPAPGPTGTGPIEVGTEWVGLSQGLGGSWGNANGFVDRFSAGGYPVQFNYGDFAAWEQDFKFPTAPGGGDDLNFADDVDLTFYTGHAGDWGFTFPGNRDDGGLDFTEAQWGDDDAEWIAIAACGPLQQTDGAGRTVVQRWGPAFQGLHALLGYSTTSWDNTVEGQYFANNLLNTFLGFFSLPVVSAWAAMAQAAQNDPTVTWAAMGPIGPGGVSNFFDNFWGKGPFGTGPDIAPSSITGFWVVRGPAG